MTKRSKPAAAKAKTAAKNAKKKPGAKAAPRATARSSKAKTAAKLSRARKPVAKKAAAKKPATKKAAAQKPAAKTPASAAKGRAAAARKSPANANKATNAKRKQTNGKSTVARPAPAKAAAPRPDALRFSESPFSKSTATAERQCQPEIANDSADSGTNTGTNTGANSETPTFPPRSAKSMAQALSEGTNGKETAKSEGAADSAMPHPRPFIDERLTNWSTDLNWKNNPVPPLSTAKKGKQGNAGGYLVSFLALAALFTVLVWSHDFNRQNRPPGAGIAERITPPEVQASTSMDPGHAFGPNGMPPIFAHPQTKGFNKDRTAAKSAKNETQQQTAKSGPDSQERYPPFASNERPVADPNPERVTDTFDVYPGEKLHVPQVGSRMAEETGEIEIAAKASTISIDDLAEIETLLGKLALNPGQPDGILDNQSEDAIRLYQEMAGLHVDGAVSQDLLADLREVVRLYEQQ